MGRRCYGSRMQRISWNVLSWPSAFGLDDGKFPDCICCAVIQRAYLSSLLPLLILLNISSNVFSTSLHVTYVFLMAPSIPFTHVILIILYFTLFVWWNSVSSVGASVLGKRWGRNWDWDRLEAASGEEWRPVLVFRVWGGFLMAWMTWFEPISS